MSESGTHGISFLGVVGVVLATLKLADVQPVANWSWWIVTLPWTVPLVFALAVLLVVGVIVVWFE